MPYLKNPAVNCPPIHPAPRVGLVLSAGGVKGLAHIGVVEVLQQAGIPIDLFVGCSIGSLIGVFYASGFDQQHVLDAAFRILPNKPNYKTLGLPSVISGFTGKGFFTTDKMYSILQEELKERTFEELKTPLRVVAANLDNGDIKVFHSGELLKPICASAAMPGFFQPVTIDKAQYVDGGIITELPVGVARASGTMHGAEAAVQW